ncbi:hypothetical protein Q3G72_030239 [Acer saccharum]|nr:hypothetical protein Q3G72_030239 [Acer saccharum]
MSIFDLDPDQNYLTAEDILVCAGWMIMVLEPVFVVQLYISSDVAQAAAWLPLVFYVVGAILLIIPVDCFHLSSRDYFFETINKTIHQMIHPSDALSVSQVFLTDLWVSTTKIFSDLVCLAYRIIRQVGASYDMDIDHVCYGSPYPICSSGSIMVPIIQILPYILRCVQCFQQFWRTGTWINCLNGLKFIFAIPVIFLPFLRNHFPDGMFIWIFLCVFNSVWMIYWDLVEDWGFRFFTEGFSFNQPDLHMLGKKWLTCGAMTFDIVLRFSWTYKLIHMHYQENHPCVFSSIVFIVTAFEIFRRFLWTSLRVKNESNGPDGASDAVNEAEPEHIGDVPVV